MFVRMLGALLLHISSSIMQALVIGNCAPRAGRLRTGVCSLCAGVLSEVHVAFACPRMDAFWYEHTDIMVFQSMCAAKGILQTLAYKMYLLGKSWDGKQVSTSVYLGRGVCLQRVLTEWLRRTWFGVLCLVSCHSLLCHTGLTLLCFHFAHYISPFLYICTFFDFRFHSLHYQTMHL